MASGDNFELLSIVKPAAPPQPLHLNATIDRYFQVSLFLLVVVGFITLTTTGHLDLLSVAVVSSALLFRGYLMLRGRTLEIPERWTSLLTLAYVLFYFADVFFVSASFLTASVHLVLFLTVVKLFSIQQDRDQLYLVVIAFLEVLAAAVLTVDTVFFAAFCVFLLLAIATFISMEMKRSAAAAPSVTPATANVLPKISKTVSALAVVMTLAVVVGATAIFFVLPRLSAGYLSAYAPRNEFVSGFSDHVQLGEIGRIKQSDSIVMHVEIEGGRGARADLKWRGVALGLFDGKAWTNPQTGKMEVLSSAPRFDPDARLSGMGRYNLSPTQSAVRNLPTDRQDLRDLQPMFYKVLMEPIGTNLLFLAPVPVSVQARMSEVAIDDGGAVYNMDRSRITESYSATSMLPQPDRVRMWTSTGNTPPDIVLNYLQLPKRVDPRIVELARSIAQNSTAPYDQAAAIENYLRTHYGYSLQLANTPPLDPLVYFLFERKEGHCEYFASAMAVMLRTLGIPARIVNGFRGGEYNDVTGSYIVRARDAHSWVEAYIPGYAWISFDPTPPDPSPAAGQIHRVMLYLDAAREFWREWVINYDFLHQRTLTISAMARGRTAGEQTRNWIRRQYEQLLSRAERIHHQAERKPRTWAMTGVLALVLIALVVSSRRILRAFTLRRLASNPAKAPQAAATIWYSRMTHTVGKKGFRKEAAQTPQEFVASISDPQLKNSVATFTRHYEHARFGQSRQDAARLPELYEEVSAKR